MRLPGTRYQEHGWEHVRKLLGHCSLQSFAHGEPERLLDIGARAAALDSYVDNVAAILRRQQGTARSQAPANSYGESALELALALVCELQARTGDWLAFANAVAAENERSTRFWDNAGGDVILRKKVNDMFAVLRDKVDSDNYQVACGRPCSPNKMYAYRMLDTAYGDIERIFANWQAHLAQLSLILGRPVASGNSIPIEVRQLRSIAHCKAEWLIRWSETLEQFGGSPGPLHTRSKRFASLKNSPEKISAMLREIGDYQQLSSNQDCDWLGDAGQAADWLEDMWRVRSQSGQGAAGDAPERIVLPPSEPFLADAAGDETEDSEADADADADVAPQPEAPSSDRDIEIAISISLPPRFIEMARAAQQHGSWTARTLAEQSMPVRLAVYLSLMGGFDDSYPSEWLDPATGELPTMQQLAVLDQISLPTLRKRRNEAIATLRTAAAVTP